MLSANGLRLLRELIQLQTTSGNRLEQKRALQVIRRNLPPIFAARYFSDNGFDSGFFLPKGNEKIDILLSAHIGRLAPFVKYPSTCDARFFASRAIPTIITRPPGGGAHGEKEWVSLRGLGTFTEILVDFLKQASKKLA